MNNEKIVALIKGIVDAKGQGTYEHEMCWVELNKECVDALKKIVYSKNFTFNAEWDFDDFMQDVMSSIFKNLKIYDATRASFYTWFRTISTRIYYKNRYNKEIISIPMYLENEDNEIVNIIDQCKYRTSVENDYFYNLSCEKLYDAINQLRDNYRDVVILCDIEGLKPGEAAKILGQKREVVYRWLNRAHDKLKDFIVAEAMEEDLSNEYEL